MRPRVKKLITVEKCGPTRKRRYRTAAAAQIALDALREIAADPSHPHHSRRHERRLHACVHCGGWHLTSQR